jgi:predicted DCC family thiol-disulfide oxidoreductase YuxK
MNDKVYYDESCYVCSLEINVLRKRGEACGIEFIDISSNEFKPGDHGDHNYDSEMVGKFDGQETIGVETFRKMYEKMGFTRSVAFSRLPVVKQICDVGYKIFAYGIRPCLPKKRS